jgi:signal transduction histidine kinase
VAALQWLARRFEQRTGIECRFHSSHEAVPAPGQTLPPGVPVAAYRTVQEALTNISKHAQATRVAVDLSLSGGVLSVEVSDNGRGLARDDLAKASSFGIRGLHERASTVGGWLDLSGGPRGTTLILSVPLDGEAAAGRADPAPAGPAPDDAGDNRQHDPSTWTPL